MFIRFINNIGKTPYIFNTEEIQGIHKVDSKVIVSLKGPDNPTRPLYFDSLEDTDKFMDQFTAITGAKTISVFETETEKLEKVI